MPHHKTITDPKGIDLTPCSCGASQQLASSPMANCLGSRLRSVVGSLYLKDLTGLGELRTKFKLGGPIGDYIGFWGGPIKGYTASFVQGSCDTGFGV